MKKDLLLKIGQVLGLVYVVVMIFIFVTYKESLTTTDSEAIGFGFFLMTMSMQVIAAILVYLVMVVPSTVTIFRTKDKSQTMLFDKKWRIVFWINCAILVSNIILFILPTLIVPFVLIGMNA